MKLLDMTSLLQDNPYPGRGVFLGRSADNRYVVMAYFIMGRSENSRNRIFTATEDGIRTEPRDPSKMTDPSLIIYHPLRVFQGKTIVTNGDQTDTIRDALAAGNDFHYALRTRSFEPDAPNYTPRISGIVNSDGSYELSILKSMDGNSECCCRYFYEYDCPQAGVGHLIHTYQGNGTPLPSFEGEPERIALNAPDASSFTNLLWENLNPDNKVSLFVRYLDRSSGKTTDIIRNKF